MASKPNSIRVCYAGLMHPADDQRFVHKQCAALVRAGYDVVYYAMADAETTINGVKVRPLPCVRDLSLWKRMLEPWRLLPKLLKENCRIYHFLDPELLPVGIILKLIFKRQVLFDAHEDYVEYALSSRHLGPARHIYACIFKLLLSLSSRIFDGFVFGDDLLEEDFLRLGARKICFHHFPLLSMFPPSPISFAQRKYDVVYAGNLSEEKGAFDILKTIFLLKSRCDKFRALLIGEPRRYIKEKFYQYIKEHKLDDCLEVTGHLPYTEVSALLDECKVGLISLLDIPKFRKQSATKLFEYMAKGLPVVSVDLPPERKYMISGVHGYLVRPGHPEAMADAVYDIITNPELGDRMASACRKQVIEKQLYAEKDCEKLLAFYDYILANPKFARRKNKSLTSPAGKAEGAAVK